MLEGVLKGIMTVLGFFNDCEGDPSALAMLSAGVSLATARACAAGLRLVGFWTTTYSLCMLNTFFLTSMSAVLTLESIHCAGVLHGDIRLANILVSDAGITIIDFGHLRLCENKKFKDKEHAQLCYLLG